MQEGEKTAAGDIGAERTARGMEWDGRSPEALGHERLVALRGPQQDRHLIEGHAAFGRRGDVARDLHAFECLARSREDRDRAIVFARRHGVGREEIALQRFQRRRGGERSGAETQIQASACRAHHGAEQLALQLGARHDIQGDDCHLAKVARAGGHCFARQANAIGMIGEAARGELARIGIEEAREVGAGFAAVGQAVEARRVQAQFLKRVRERAGKTGKAGDRGEVRQFVAMQGIGRDTGGERLAHESAHEDELAAVHAGGGELHDEIAKGAGVDVQESLDAGGAGDLFGCQADGGQDQDRTGGGGLFDEVHRTRAQLRIAGGGGLEASEAQVLRVWRWVQGGAIVIHALVTPTVSVGCG